RSYLPSFPTRRSSDLYFFNRNEQLTIRKQRAKVIGMVFYILCPLLIRLYASIICKDYFCLIIHLYILLHPLIILYIPILGRKTPCVESLKFYPFVRFHTIIIIMLFWLHDGDKIS